MEHRAGQPGSPGTDCLAAVTLNFEDWATYLLRQLRRAVMLTADPVLVALDEEVRSYPNVAAVPGSPKISE